MFCQIDIERGTLAAALFFPSLHLTIILGQLVCVHVVSLTME